MKREDIEKAAINNDSRLVAFRAFLKGADWRINNVWHNATEQPRKNTWYIAQIGNGAFDTFADSENWKVFARGINIIRWAYIEDLIPNTED